MYFTDGTAGGTVLVGEVFSGPVGSEPVNLVMADGDPYFQADDPYLGNELFRLAPAGAYSRRLGHSGSGATLTASAPVLGDAFRVTVDQAPANTALNILIFGLALQGAICFQTEPGSSVWVDPTKPLTCRIWSGSSLAANIPVPNSISLMGLRRNTQNLSIPAIPGGANSIGTSNGVSLVFGN